MSELLYWCDGSGRLQLELTQAQAECGSHSGDCESDCRALLALPEIACQVQAWADSDLIAHLGGFGAWEDSELQDSGWNILRTLWLACGDILEDVRNAD